MSRGALDLRRSILSGQAATAIGPRGIGAEVVTRFVRIRDARCREAGTIYSRKGLEERDRAPRCNNACEPRHHGQIG
jgi:hypothetical protein